jgi:hypothetical protein
MSVCVRKLRVYEALKRWLKFVPLLLEFAAAEVTSAKIRQEICKWKQNETKKNSLLSPSLSPLTRNNNSSIQSQNNGSVSLSLLSLSLSSLSLSSLSRIGLGGRVYEISLYLLLLPPISLSLCLLSLYSLFSLSLPLSKNRKVPTEKNNGHTHKMNTQKWYSCSWTVVLLLFLLSCTEVRSYTRCSSKSDCDYDGCSVNSQ